MKKSQVKKRITQLRNDISKHNKLYYVNNSPEISDTEYDRLFDELERLEKEYPEFARTDSPTQRVGVDIVDGFVSVSHRTPMLSMDNTYSHDEVREFDKRIKKSLGTGDISYAVELKIDGVSVNLHYERGVFHHGATRGDGRQGDDISHNLKTIKNIPMKLSPLRGEKLPTLIEIRGEAYISKKRFIGVNEERKKNNEPLFANPRNACAGSLKLLDSAEARKRHLDIFVWGIGYYEGIHFSAHSDVIEYLRGHGLNVNPHFKLCNSIEEVIEYCDLWEDKRKDLEYETDGMVIKVDSLDFQRGLGLTTKAPRWIIAYKFKAEQAMTRIKDVKMQVGRTGVITPVAVMDPVLISGTTVSRATLHNFDEIKRLGVKIGDHVYIEKSGEIIPKVIKVIKEKRNGGEKKIIIPDVCPYCESPVHKAPEEVALRCDNVSCPASLKQNILHFASRNAMDIEGMGKSVVDMLVENKLIRDYGDIYSLGADALIKLERFALKSSENLIKAIEKSKTNELHRLIFGLGIRHVGTRAAWILASKYGSIGALKKVSRETLMEVREIGPVMAEGITDFFSTPENINVLDKMRKAGVLMKGKHPARSESPIEGKTIVVTGTLKGYARGDIEILIRRLGAQASSSISKKTDFLLCGIEPGSKLAKAKALGVTIINENDFKKMIGEK